MLSIIFAIDNNKFCVYNNQKELNVENTNDLQTALNHFNLLNKNIENLIKINKKENKKFFGHSIFKKSDNAIFSFIETVFLICASTFGCAVLKANNLLPFDFFLSATIACVSTSITAAVCNHLIYFINNHLKGPIGRTYAKMQCDYYFCAINYFIKKDFKSLMTNTSSNEQKKKDFIEFATILNNFADNLQLKYEKLCKKVEKLSTNKQKKWEPILNHIEGYSLYLSNNAEKFNLYAKNLQISDNPILIPTDDNLENLKISHDKQHSSEFLEFKQYLLKKRFVEEAQKHFNMQNSLYDSNDKNNSDYYNRVNKENEINTL